MQTNVHKQKSVNTKPRKSWQECQACKGKATPVRYNFKREEA